MTKRVYVLRILLFVVGSIAATQAQETVPSAPNGSAKQKPLAVTSETQSDAVIAVPPATSVRVGLLGANSASADKAAFDLPSWISKEAALNGLQSPGVAPWHISIIFDRFDEDGDKVNHGVYEEYWAGPKKFKRVYNSDNFKQTDYATEKGLYRVGEQRWPSRAEEQVRDAVVAPFYDADDLEGFHGTALERAFGEYKFHCVAMEKNNGISDPMQYCFDSDSSVLRYSRGSFWWQTVYNDVVSFQGRNVAKWVDVTNGGKPYLTLRVTTLESLSSADNAVFAVPENAAGPLGGPITGRLVTPIGPMVFPDWPSSLRSQHVVVKVQILIGKDGRVIGAKVISGPPEAHKACEAAARKLKFKPTFVLDAPVEVEEPFEFQLN